MIPLGYCQQQTQLDATHSTAGCRRPQRRMRQQTRHTKRSETDVQSVSMATLNTPVRLSETHRPSHAGPTPTKHQLPQFGAPRTAAALTCKRLQHGERQHGCGCVVNNKVRCPPPLYLKLSFLLLQMYVDTCVHVCVIYMLPTSCDLHVYDFHQYPTQQPVGLHPDLG